MWISSLQNFVINVEFFLVTRKYEKGITLFVFILTMQWTVSVNLFMSEDFLQLMTPLWTDNTHHPHVITYTVPCQATVPQTAP